MFEPQILEYCSICYMEVAEVLRLKCEHFFCRECTVAYLDNLISTRQVTNLKCPQYQCGETLKYEHFSPLLSPE